MATARHAWVTEIPISIPEASTRTSPLVINFGSRGIRAIRFVGSNGAISQWLGDPNECPQTERLVFNNVVDAIEAGFDGCKLVSLRALEPTRPSSNFRTSTYWYPHVPPPSLFLNEQIFPQKKRYINEYKPLFWIHFGAGERLRSLTGMRVTYSVSIEKIEFLFESFESLALGRHEPDPYAQYLDFAIDGSHGEIINCIEIFYVPGPEPSPSIDLSEIPGPLDNSHFITFKVRII
ncbi:unnamed protein product [Clonostachys rosea]|uniref:DUF7600 domain-containing protein n=1 Tax=Bionectria ochroleuca TaxID=29856 RepID=A0ABY6UVJ9_BIOOC|nr:unnamed protein product [Clonostachys rosea]